MKLRTMKLRTTRRLLAPWLLASLLNESRLRWLWLGGFFAMSMAVQALGQGCAQCLDSTRATPPSVQAAYRHAIILLGGAGATLFISGTLLLRRRR